MAPHLASLREHLATVVQGGREAGPAWPTGIAPLDRALGGGIARGRITELTGALATGKTALLRGVIARMLQAGQWVAWIDARRTLAPAPWASLGARFVVIRPPDHRRSAWIADLLLRSGVFAAVVLDGAPPLSRVHGVRLAQLARERDAACVVLTHHHPGEVSNSSRVAGAVRLRVELANANANANTGTDTRQRQSQQQHVMRITVEKGGQVNGHKQLEVSRVVNVARRMCTDTEIPDRRGVARSARHTGNAHDNGTDSSIGQQSYHHEHGQSVAGGGLGVSTVDLYGTGIPGHPARLAAGLDDASDRLESARTDARDRTPPREHQHVTHNDVDHYVERTAYNRGTRDWTAYRGRRRVAESEYGHPSRRTRARERAGTVGASASDTHASRSGYNGYAAPYDDSPRRGRDGRASGSRNTSDSTALG